LQQSEKTAVWEWFWTKSRDFFDIFDYFLIFLIFLHII